MLAALTALLRNDLFQTTLAALLTKGVGSLARIWDDRNAPDDVRKKTEKREGLLLALTTGFTALADTVCSRQILPHVQKAFKLPNLGNYKKLLMIPPIVIGYALSEVTCRLIAPKTPSSPRRDDDGETSFAPGGRLNVQSRGDCFDMNPVKFSHAAPATTMASRMRTPMPTPAMTPRPMATNRVSFGI